MSTLEKFWPTYAQPRIVWRKLRPREIHKRRYGSIHRRNTQNAISLITHPVTIITDRDSLALQCWQHEKRKELESIVLPTNFKIIVRILAVIGTHRPASLWRGFAPRNYPEPSKRVT